jgi:hypothetical protein
MKYCVEMKIVFRLGPHPNVCEELLQPLAALNIIKVQSLDEDERHTTSLSIVDGWRDVQGWLCRSEQAHENKRERH